MGRTMTTSATTINHGYLPHPQRCVKKTHGGKSYLARRIIDLFPARASVYTEPYIGGGSIYLNLKPSMYGSVVINDLDLSTWCLWDVLKFDFDKFQSMVGTTMYNESAFIDWRDRRFQNQVYVAVQCYVVSRMSRGGIGKTFAWSERQRGGQPGDLNAWMTGLQRLQSIHDRLVTDNTTIRNDDGLQLIEEYGRDPDAFIYADPPYPHTSRTARQVYNHEMTDAGHMLFLAAAQESKAKMAISGYHCDMYDKALSHWRLVEFDLPNHSGQGVTKQRRTECLWMNYERLV